MPCFTTTVTVLQGCKETIALRGANPKPGANSDPESVHNLYGKLTKDWRVER